MAVKGKAGGELLSLRPSPIVLVVVGKGTWAVKLCSNKLLQLLIGGASDCRLSCMYSGHKTVVVICEFSFVSKVTS